MCAMFAREWPLLVFVGRVSRGDRSEAALPGYLGNGRGVFHIETLIIYKLRSRRFSRPNDHY